MEDFRVNVGAGLPILLNVAGYSSGWKTYSIVQVNRTNSPILVILLNQFFNTFGPITFCKFIGSGKSAIGVTNLNQMVYNTGVGIYNGFNSTSSHKHTLVKVLVMDKLPV